MNPTDTQEGTRDQGEGGREGQQPGLEETGRTQGGLAPGNMAFSGVALVYHRCQSRGYCSKEFMSPWKLVSLSSSVMLSQ